MLAVMQDAAHRRWGGTVAGDAGILVTSVIGGYLGARLTQWLPAWLVHGLIVVLTATVTVAFLMGAI
jgi:uncharacterized membrane protein YfcA